MTDKDYPEWICGDCGEKHGRGLHSGKMCNPYATWHPNICGVCGAGTMVTEPRDFGHLKDGWQND